MKKFLGNARVDLRRAFFSFGFLLAVVGMCLANLSSASTEGMALEYGYGDVLYLYRVAHMQGFSMLFMVFATLPYATSFCTDWNNQFIRSVVIRTNLKSYGISKVVTSALAGGSAVALGELLYIFVLRFYLQLPLVDRQSPFFGNAAGNPVYGSLLVNGDYAMYFIFHILISFFAAAFFAVLALWVSTHITNVFVTFATPILAYYLINKLSIGIGVPKWLNFYNALFGTFKAGEPGLSLLYSIIFCTSVCILLGILIVRQIKRRLEHG